MPPFLNAATVAGRIRSPPERDEQVGPEPVASPEKPPVEPAQVDPLDERSALPEPPRHEMMALIDDPEFMPERADGLLDVLGDRPIMGVVVSAEQNFHESLYEGLAVPAAPSTARVFFRQDLAHR